MLILDNIDSKYQDKFRHDFEKIIKNHNDVNICFGDKNSGCHTFGFKNILFKIDDYDDIEKKIIRNIICYFLIIDGWQYIEIKKYIKDNIYYVIINKNDVGSSCCFNSCCNLGLGYSIIYDKNTSNVNYYSRYKEGNERCISCNYFRHYNLNSLFNTKYKEFKTTFTTDNNKINFNNDNNDKNKNSNNNNSNNCDIIDNDTKIKMQIITNTTNIPMEFQNMNFEQIFNKLILLFGKGKIIYDNDIYKFIKY